MNAPDAVRGPEGQSGSPAANAEAVRTDSSLHGVTSIPSPMMGRPVVARRSSMGKWIAAGAVLALMVFGITFALNFVGTSGSTTIVVPDSSEGLTLTFATKKQPPEEDGKPQPQPIDTELHTEGFVDFWFENTNDKPVTIGLLKTSCSCEHGRIKLFLLPPGSKMAPGSEATVEGKASATLLSETTEEGVKVAPKQVGWVRLGWSGDKNSKMLSIDLWLNGKGIGPWPRLEARVAFHDPMMIDKKLGAINLLDPPVSVMNLPQDFPVYCWSVTRPSLKIQTKITGGRPGSAEPLTVSKVERLDDKSPAFQELLAKEPKLKSLYQVNVTLRATDDGKQVDAGPFRRRMELKLDGYPGEPLTFELQGQILGDMRIIGLTSGRVDFSTFRGKKGSETLTLTLESRSPKLELDNRTAEFLNVELSEIKKPSGDTVNWQMKVNVMPGAVTGRFPRDEKDYRDCAIYVRPAGDPNARATRIVVEGTASD